MGFIHVSGTRCTGVWDRKFLHKLTLFVGVFLKLDSLLENLLLSYSRSIFVIVVL